MKRVFTLMITMILCAATFTYAGTTSVVLKARTAKQVKKDGTPDKRFKANKAATTKPAGPLKKDGTPDMRFKANKAAAAAKPAGPTKKDGTADMRFKTNKAAKAEPAKKAAKPAKKKTK